MIDIFLVFLDFVDCCKNFCLTSRQYVLMPKFRVFVEYLFMMLVWQYDLDMLLAMEEYPGSRNNGAIRTNELVLVVSKHYYFAELLNFHHYF